MLRTPPPLATTLRTLALLCWLLGAVGLSQALPAGYPPLPAATLIEAELLAATNDARRREGLAGLAPDDALALAARHHAREMAELDYFSHTSPVTDHATASHRVAKAGSPLVTIGENLAVFRGGDTGVAAGTIDGWLDSPGHRANLLGEHFTHVGFGVAQNSRGDTYVVQVLAFEPARLVEADAQPFVRERYRLELTVATPEATTAAFSVAGRAAAPQALSAGEQRVTLSVMPGERVHLSAGVQLGGGGFVVEDAGWVTLEGGAWQPDPGLPRRALAIRRVQTERIDEALTVVDLGYDGALGLELAAFVDGVHQPAAAVAPGRLRVMVPREQRDAVIGVGEVDGGRVRIFHRFVVEDAGAPRLVSSTPRPQ